jgi:hypothetical protein
MKQIGVFLFILCVPAVPRVWAGQEAAPQPGATLADLGKLRDITGVEQVPEPPPEPPWPVWLWLVPAWLLAGGLPVWLWRRRRREAPPPPADQWALAEIKRIEGLRLSGNGDVERYHTLLSDVVRRYLELRFQLPASQQTTPEFLQATAASGLLAPEQQALLGGFLERCDLAKFARAGFSADECRQAAETARTFVQETAARGATPGAARLVETDVRPQGGCWKPERIPGGSWNP